MEQAVRSGMKNIPEGYKQQILAGYIKLTGVSRGSLIQQANYLIDKLIESLKDKHTKEGGFNENLLKKRLEFRQKGNPND